MNYQSFPITDEMRKDLETFLDGAIKMIYRSLKRDTYLLEHDMSWSYLDDLHRVIIERDDARYIARKLYKRLCDEHKKRIVAEEIAERLTVENMALKRNFRLLAGGE